MCYKYLLDKAAQYWFLCVESANRKTTIKMESLEHFI